MKPSTQQVILICLLAVVTSPQTALGDAMVVSKAMTASTIVMGVLCLPYARASLTSPTSRGPTLDSQQAEEVLHALLNNVYRAFDHRDESLVYDRLGLSISGDLLTDVYLLPTLQTGPSEPRHDRG